VETLIAFPLDAHQPLGKRLDPAELLLTEQLMSFEVKITPR
jgi:hypothetical protein